MRKPRHSFLMANSSVIIGYDLLVMLYKILYESGVDFKILRGCLSEFVEKFFQLLLTWCVLIFRLTHVDAPMLVMCVI